MKRLAIAGLALILVVPAVFAARKKDPAGTIKDNVYQDLKYDFQIKLHENWKGTRVGKADENTRLVILQKNYGVPSRYADAKDYTQIPRLVVFADTSSMSVTAFLDSLLSQSYKSGAKKEIQKEFDFLSQPDIITKGRRTLTISGQTAIFWNGESRYVKDIVASSGSNQTTQVSGGYSGSIVAIKNGSTLVVFQLACEREFGDVVAAEAMTMMNSITWGKPAN